MSSLAQNSSSLVITAGLYVSKDYNGDFGLELANDQMEASTTVAGKFLVTTKATAKLITFTYRPVVGSPDDLYFQNFMNLMQDNLQAAASIINSPFTVSQTRIENGVAVKDITTCHAWAIQKGGLETNVVNSKDGTVDNMTMSYTIIGVLRRMSDYHRIIPLS